jgi:hypothetical protein
VIIAIALDPSVLERLDEPSPPKPTPRAEPAPPPKPQPRRQERKPTPEDRESGAALTPRALVLRLEGGAHVNQLPSSSWVAGAAIGTTWNHLRAEADASVSSTETVVFGGARAEFSRYTLGLRVCGVLRPTARTEVWGCAGGATGLTNVSTSGLTDGRSLEKSWGALRLGPGLAWSPVDALALVARADAELPLSRTHYEVEGLGTIYEQQGLGFRGFLGIEGRVPLIQ